MPFYRQVIDQVLLAVADGRLKPGTQLPTVRQLAVDLSVNLNTIARAYREMEIRGIVETQQGTGHVRRPPQAREDARPSAARPSTASWTSSCPSPPAQGFTSDEFADALLGKTEEAGRR